jgi:hypothetical protein
MEGLRPSPCTLPPRSLSGLVIAVDDPECGAGLSQVCSNIFTSDEDMELAAAAAGASAGPPGLGPWCCETFCFVNASCPSARPFPAFANDGSPLMVTFEACVDNQDVVRLPPPRQQCPFPDSRWASYNFLLFASLAVFCITLRFSHCRQGCDV